MISFSESKKSYTMYIPLQFWFCRNPNMALPLLTLHHTDVKIHLELNDLNSCFIQTPTNYMKVKDNLVSFQFGEYMEQTVKGKKAVGMFSNFVSDPTGNGGTIFYTRVTRNNFISPMNIVLDTPTYLNNYSDYVIRSRTGTSFCLPKETTKPKLYNSFDTSNINIQDCYLLVNYIYLDSEERNRFIQTKHEYLIEQLHLFNPQTISSSNYVASADSINPTKFITWHTQQQYLLDNNNNDYFNYTDDYLYEKINNKYVLKGKSLIKTETILFNGFDRISNRNYNYFNHVQAYQHFVKTPSEGLNIYSFGLFPKEFQPNGSCNMSYISNVEIQMGMKTIISDMNTAIFCGYSVSYNVLRIIDGLAGLVFIR
jgi:hypothetical protein